jgi:hypothetical protein
VNAAGATGYLPYLMCMKQDAVQDVASLYQRADDIDQPRSIGLGNSGAPKTKILVTEIFLTC